MVREVDRQTRLGLGHPELVPGFHRCTLFGLLRRSFFSSRKTSPQRYTGFTLAEILIVLGIIGVVAALTIPALINSSNERELRVKWKKEYSVLSQALQEIYAEEGVYWDDVVVSWEYMPRWLCMMKNHLKATGVGIQCPADIDSIPADGTLQLTGKKYWHDDNKWQRKNGTKVNLGGNPWYSVGLNMQLADGTIFYYNCYSQFVVDVNGFKPPNTVGKDIFITQMEPKSTTLYTQAKSGMNCPACQGSPPTVYVDGSNYKTDCETGSGWGCSSAYLLE